MSDSKDRDEYLDFITSSKLAPPEKLNQEVLDFIKKDLEPRHLFVFFKLLLIQAFIAVLTMMFCPQFDLSLTNNYDLFHFFHHTVGPVACMAICGSIFIGSGAIFASYLLTLPEIERVRESKFLYYISITSVGLMPFMFFGAELYLNLTVAWFLGASFSGVLFFELNRLIRNRIQHQLQD